MFEQVNKMMIDCVQGTVLNNNDFTTHIFEGTSAYMVELQPTGKSLQNLFKSVRLTIDKNDFSISKIDMWEPSGDNTLISFQHKQMNTTISDAVFSVN